MPRVSYYRKLEMRLSKYIMMLADVDDLEMTVVNSTWLVTKSKFPLQYNNLIIFPLKFIIIQKSLLILYLNF